MNTLVPSPAPVPPRLTLRMKRRILGRKVALAGQINVLIAFFLPWMQINAFGVDAFHLSSVSSLDLLKHDWVLATQKGILVLAAIAIVVMLCDMRRSMGKAPVLLAFAIGFLETAWCAAVFALEPPLRQWGATACIVGGCITFFGGFYLLGAPWTSTAREGESFRARVPWGTAALIFLNTAIFLILSFRADFAAIIRDLGLIGGSLRWYAFLTSMFLHIDWYHLLSNMLFLFPVGVLVERRLGWGWMLIVYLLSGIGGSVLSVLIDPRMFMPAVGASGAVAGILATASLLAPMQKLRFVFHILVTVGWFWIPAAWIFAVWLILQALHTLFFVGGNVTTVGYWAHIGGAVIGCAAGWMARRGAGPEPKTPPKEQSALLPFIMIGISFAICLAAVLLTFTTLNLFGTVASFQRAWKSGDLQRIGAFFPEANRAEMTDELRTVLARIGRRTPEDRKVRGIALLRLQIEEAKSHAVFATAVGGVDPYRDPDTGRMRVYFEKIHGRWCVRDMDLSGYTPGEDEGSE